MNWVETSGAETFVKKGWHLAWFWGLGFPTPLWCLYWNPGIRLFI